jgi:hypothetical protein
LFFAAPQYHGPKALGPFKIDDFSFPFARVFAILGRPAGSEPVLCYESTDRNKYLWFEEMAGEPKVVGSVFLSKFPNCFNVPKKNVVIDRAMWRTDKGVGLGSTIAELELAHGKAQAIEKIKGRDFRDLVFGGDPNKVRPELGESVWMYGGPYAGISDDLRIAYFGIKQGKVVWIFLSHNE